MFKWPWRWGKKYGNGVTLPAPDADPRYVGRFCDQPFRMAQSYENGNVHFCCTAWLPVAAGNLHDEPLSEVWNSKWAQTIRKSILDGSYRYCSELNCPRLQGREGGLVPNSEVRDPYYRRIIDEGLTELPMGPRSISVAHDPTCNLSCPACRSELYKCDGEKREKTRRIHEHMFDVGLRDAEFITMSTNGDPFASPFYLAALREFDWRAHKNLRINFITNAVRLTPEMWESVKNCHGSVNSMHISINAATEATFNINQRGGNWKKLLANLKFISDLRRKGAIKLFSLGFYVMDNNFREMKDFVAYAKTLKVDSVFFGHVLRPYSVSDEEFARMAVHLPAHPDHAEFLEVLRDPVFKDHTVRISNMGALVSGSVATEEYDSSYGARFADQMTWDDFVRFLALDEAGTAAARDILSGHKLAVARLFLRPAVGGGEPPIAMLPPFGVDGKSRVDLEEYLQARCPEGGELSYQQNIALLELKCRDAVGALLNPAVRNLANRIPVRAMLGVETGSNPMLEASVAYHLKPEDAVEPIPEGLNLRRLQQRAGLNDSEIEFVSRAINGLKDAFARHLTAPGEEAGESPADQLAQTSRGEQSDAWRLQMETSTFHDRMRAIAIREQGVRRGIIARIGEEKWRLVHAECPQSLLDVDTGYDPFYLEVERRRAARETGFAVRP